MNQKLRRLNLEADVHVAESRVTTWKESLAFWKEEGPAYAADVARCRRHLRSYVAKRTWAEQRLAAYKASIKA